MRQEAIPQIAITVSKTSDGESEYIQITSSDMMTLNVVLVATSVTIDDRRPNEEETEGAKVSAKNPKPVKAWCMVEDGKLDPSRMSLGASGGRATGMIPVDIRPLPKRKRAKSKWTKAGKEYLARSKRAAWNGWIGSVGRSSILKKRKRARRKKA